MRVDFLFLFLFFPVEVGRLGAVTSGRREASVAVSSRRDFFLQMDSGVVCIKALQCYYEARIQGKSMVRCATVCPKKPDSGR